MQALSREIGCQNVSSLKRLSSPPIRRLLEVASLPSFVFPSRHHNRSGLQIQLFLIL